MKTPHEMTRAKKRPMSIRDLRKAYADAQADKQRLQSELWAQRKRNADRLEEIHGLLRVVAEIRVERDELKRQAIQRSEQP